MTKICNKSATIASALARYLAIPVQRPGIYDYVLRKYKPWAALGLFVQLHVHMRKWWEETRDILHVTLMHENDRLNRITY